MRFLPDVPGGQGGLWGQSDLGDPARKGPYNPSIRGVYSCKINGLKGFSLSLNKESPNTYWLSSLANGPWRSLRALGKGSSLFGVRKNNLWDTTPFRVSLVSPCTCRLSSQIPGLNLPPHILTLQVAFIANAVFLEVPDSCFLFLQCRTQSLDTIQPFSGFLFLLLFCFFQC